MGADCEVGVLGSNPREDELLNRFFLKTLARNNVMIDIEWEMLKRRDIPVNFKGIIPCLKDGINLFLQNREFSKRVFLFPFSRHSLTPNQRGYIFVGCKSALLPLLRNSL